MCEDSCNHMGGHWCYDSHKCTYPCSSALGEVEKQPEDTSTDHDIVLALPLNSTHQCESYNMCEDSGKCTYPCGSCESYDMCEDSCNHMGGHWCYDSHKCTYPCSSALGEVEEQPDASSDQDIVLASLLN